MQRQAVYRVGCRGFLEVTNFKVHRDPAGSQRKNASQSTGGFFYALKFIIKKY